MLLFTPTEDESLKKIGKEGKKKKKKGNSTFPIDRSRRKNIKEEITGGHITPGTGRSH